MLGSEAKPATSIENLHWFRINHDIACLAVRACDSEQAILHAAEYCKDNDFLGINCDVYDFNADITPITEDDLKYYQAAAIAWPLNRFVMLEQISTYLPPVPLPEFKLYKKPPLYEQQVLFKRHNRRLKPGQ